MAFLRAQMPFPPTEFDSDGNGTIDSVQISFDVFDDAFPDPTIPMRIDVQLFQADLAALTGTPAQKLVQLRAAALAKLKMLYLTRLAELAAQAVRIKPRPDLAIGAINSLP